MTASGIPRKRVTESVLGTHVDVISWSEVLDRVRHWSAARESRAICICNVHSLVMARQNRKHAQSLKSADMITPDGAPVAWALREKGHSGQDRISGPDLMMKACEQASETGTKIFLYGGTETTLARLTQNLRLRFPALEVAGAISPPFRDLTDAEDSSVVDRINESGAGIVWVGLGCPKQEAWLLAHQGRVNAVMIGVGAAFDFHAGVIKRAPLWMQRSSLEWLHRLAQDPRRLAKRYLVTNTVFALAILQELILPKWIARATGLVRQPADLSD